MLVLLWGLLLAGPARAEHIDLSITGVGYDVPAQLEYDVRAALDRVHTFDEEVLGLDLPDKVALRVRIFADRAAYDRLAADAGFRPGETIGFFNAQQGGVLWRNTDVEALRGTLVHEAAHYLLALGGARPPRWMNEGLSEVFERFRVSGNGVWAEPDLAVMRWLAGLQDRPTLETLLTMGDRAWASEVGPLGRAWYTYGWAVCAFLASSESGRASLGAALRGYAHGGPSGALAAVGSTWPGGLSQAEVAWTRWATGSPHAVVLPTAVAKTTELRPKTASDPCPGGILLRKGDEDVCVHPSR